MVKQTHEFSKKKKLITRPLILQMVKQKLKSET